MSGRLTFTKFKCTILQVRPDSFRANVLFKPDRRISALNVWVPRSNVGTDDDKRLDEIASQLETNPRIETDVRIADWFAKERGWLVK